MKALCVSKVKFSEVLSQVLEELRPKFLDLFRVILEQELQAIRDRIIRTRGYVRGNVKKRWGYTVRKWIQTPLGTLEQVRIPRIREVQPEVSLFCDPYVKRSGEISAVLFGDVFVGTEQPAVFSDESEVIPERIKCQWD